MDVQTEEHPVGMSVMGMDVDLTRFNKIATQGAPQMAVDKEVTAYRESTLTILSLTCAYSMYSPP